MGANRPGSEQREEAAALERFRDQFERDSRAGAVASAEEYARRFPGHEAAVAAEHRRLVAGRAEGDGRSNGSLPSLATTIGRLEAQGVEHVDERGEVARGGMGAVLRTHDPVLQRDLAMKVILDDDGSSSRAATSTDGDEASEAARRAVARFVLEAQVTAQLDHPGVVPVHRLGIDDRGRVFFTMKLVNGRALDGIFALAAKREEGWTLTKAVQLFLKVCDALAFAHSKGVIHRDVKPANVMVGAYGEVYLMDWGLAKVHDGPEDPLPRTEPDSDPLADPALGAGDASDRGLTRLGAIIGTPTYMAPELARGEPADARTDVYAVGAMLYELLAEKRPYAAESSSGGELGALAALAAGPPVPLAEAAPGAPEDLRAIAEKAMARDPAARYESARDLGHDVQLWLEGRVVLASRHGPIIELRKWIGRNRGTAAAVAAALTVAIAGALAYAVRERASARKIRASLGREVVARAEAEANATKADGLRDATLSISLAAKDPALALRLALMAAERAPGRFANEALSEALLRHREAKCLWGHDGYVENVAWSPSGARLASVGGDETAIVWDPETGSAVRRLRAAPGAPYIVAFLDERRLVVRTAENVLTVYDAETGAALSRLDAETAGISAAALLRDGDGDGIVVGGRDGSVAILSSRDGKETHRHALGAPVTSIASAGGLLFATTASGPAMAWTISDGRAVAAFPPARPPAEDEPKEPFASSPAALVPSPDGRFAATLQDGVALWSVASGRCLGWWPTGRDAWCAFSADGRTATLSGAAGPAVRFDLAAALVESREPAGFGAAICSPDGRLAVSIESDGSATAYDAATSRRLAAFRGHSYAVAKAAFRPDGRRMATASHDTTVRIWDTSFSDLELGADRAFPSDRRLGIPDPACRLALAWTGSAAGPSGRVEIVELATGRALWTLDPESAGSPVWSRDGSLLATTEDRANVRLYEAETGQLRFTSAGPYIGPVLFSPDGGRLAVKCARGDVVAVDVLDAGSGAREATVLEGLPSIVDLGGFSPDGKRIVVGTGYGIATIADVESGAKTSITGHTGLLIGAKFSPDGAVVFTSAVDSSVRAWDAATGNPRWTTRGFPMRGLRIQVASDGAHILVEGGYLLDAATGALLADLSAAPEAGFSVRSIAPDGRRLWLWSADGRVRREFPLDLVAAARAAGPRETTPSEEQRLELFSEREQPSRSRAFAERHPSARAWNEVGTALLARGDALGAEDAFRHVVDVSPEHPFGHFGMALVLAKRLPSASSGERAAAIDRILGELERARDRDWPEFSRLLREPDLAPLYDLPRFRALERRGEGGR